MMIKWIGKMLPLNYQLLIIDDQMQNKLTVSYKEILQLYGIAFLVQMLFSLYINGGKIILISYFYDNEAIGMYSLAANVAKISMYILSIFTSALLPKVSLVHRKINNWSNNTSCAILDIGKRGIRYGKSKSDYTNGWRL